VSESNDDLPDARVISGEAPPPVKPAGTREFTPRALIAGAVVAVIMGASYPYVVLKLGFGPNVSVVAAFFGYLFLGILFKSFNRWENNIVQTAGTSAAQTAFMCIILAAFDLVSQNPKLDYPVPVALDPTVVAWMADNQLSPQVQEWFFWLTGRSPWGLDPKIFSWATDYHFSPTTLQSFLWLTAASVLGLLLAVPLRRHYIVEEKLTYADGVAAAETIVVLDARGDEAKRAARALFLATLASAIAWFMTTKWSGEIFGYAVLDGDCNLVYEPLLHENVLPTMFGLTYATAGAGFAVSLLAVGSGMIVGNRINISMGVGAIIAWIIGPHVLLDAGIIQAPPQHLECGVAPTPSPGRNSILLWMMWPGTGMLVAAGLTALALKWRTLARTFSTLSSKSIDVAEFPLKWVGIGVVTMTLALIALQQAFFDVPLWTTVIAIVLSVPLMLVGLRVLGETNWGPISQLTNMMQVIFAALVPRNITANLAASGTTGTIAVQSEAIMQDYKAGHIIGSTPRYLTYSQLLAAPIGAIAVSLSYPAFRDLYGVGGDTGLSAPGSRRIAGFSEVLAEGFDKLPPWAPQFLVIGAIVGILITLLEIKWKKWVPSATGLGIGMMVPGNVVLTMVIGGIVLSLWRRANRTQADKLSMPLASGLIAGEALAAIIVPLIVAIGLLSANPDPVHAGCGAFGDAMQLIPGCRR
jgi:uncharacterized oligopeptide transporter (OPT) family protein